MKIVIIYLCLLVNYPFKKIHHGKIALHVITILVIFYLGLSIFGLTGKLVKVKHHH